MANFGTFMSFMQIGSTVFAVAVPSLTSLVHAQFGSYKSLYWVAVGMLLVAAAAVGIPKPASPTFGLRSGLLANAGATAGRYASYGDV